MSKPKPMDSALDEAFVRYVNAKRSGGHYPLEDLENDDDAEVHFALERVRRARAAFEEMLRRKAVTGEDRALMNDLKAELYKAERELSRLKRTRESAPASHLL
jgi:S-adenosylmethionine:diacylglycerol 3-amino-3-carboxypropyl transferase